VLPHEKRDSKVNEELKMISIKNKNSESLGYVAYHSNARQRLIPDGRSRVSSGDTGTDVLK
jgi:hypothetical protein